MNLRYTRWMATLIFVIAGLATAAMAGGAPQFAVEKKVTLGGDGGWDYMKLDAEGKRLFIARATRVMVIDTATLQPVGEILNTNGVHGIALAPEMGKGFTSNGREANVTVFDLKTLKEIGRVPTDPGPDAIVYDPASQRVFTMNGRSDDATAIDAASEKAVGKVALGGGPEFAAADGKGTIFVNLEDKNELVAFDARTLQITKRWPLTGCEEPSGLALDERHHRLFSGCHNQVVAVSDAEKGRVVATVPIGKGVDANRFDAKLGLAFSSNGDGTLTVIKEVSPDKYEVAQTVTTERGARTMDLDPKTHKIYTVTAQFGPPAAGERRPSILPGTFELLVVAPQ